jgi:O-antigen/teichoic acid export membrane protein
MSKTRIYARNLGANWVSYAANLAVAFFMSPFMVHSLGDARYGVWTLLVSLTGYLGLVDIGVRGGTGRYINYYLGRSEREQVSNIVSSSLLFYAIISVAIFAASAVLALFFSRLFPKIEPELASEAKWVLLLLGLNVWIGLFSSTFAQLLAAAERFDLQMIADVFVLVARTAATVWILIVGRGLVELALVQVGSGVLGCALTAAFARWKGPHTHIHWEHFRWASFKEVFVFGSWAFLGNASLQLGLYASTAIIGMLIGAKEVTIYSIGGMLIGYATAFVGRITAILVPDIMKAGGRGDLAALRQLVGRGTRATMFLAVPVLVGFMTLGGEFIDVWMGPKYTASAWILLILTTARFGALATEPIGTVLLALGDVKLCTLMNALPSFVALAISVGLVLFTDLGVYGVAIGAALPMILTHNVWLFIVGYRKLGGRLGEAVRSTTLRWATGAIVFAVPCLLVSHLIPHGGWLVFWLKVGIVSIVYLPIGSLLVLQQDESLRIVREALSWLASTARRLAANRGTP